MPPNYLEVLVNVPVLIADSSTKYPLSSIAFIMQSLLGGRVVIGGGHTGLSGLGQFAGGLLGGGHVGGGGGG